MNAGKVQIGIMGCGGYGETARRNLRNTGAFEIVACHDTNAATVHRAAYEENAKAYTDVQAFLSHPQLQAVSINTPIPLHAEHMRLCLDNGKHVFVTKPVTASVDDARQVAELAKARNLAVMVGHHARLRPAIRMIQQTIEQGKLGRLCNVIIASCSSRGVTGDPREWRFDDRRNPGGPLLHCGVHTLDILLGILGPVRRVAAMCQDDITPHKVENNYMVLLEFANGVQASLTSNYTTGYLHTMHWMGVDANLHLHEHITHLGQCDLFYQRRRTGDCEPWEAVALPNDPSYPDDHGGVLEKSFARQILHRQPHYDNLEQAIAVMEVLEAAVSSARTGRFVTLGQDESKTPNVCLTLTPAAKTAIEAMKGTER